MEFGCPKHTLEESRTEKLAYVEHPCDLISSIHYDHVSAHTQTYILGFKILYPVVSYIRVGYNQV